MRGREEEAREGERSGERGKKRRESEEEEKKKEIEEAERNVALMIHRGHWRLGVANHRLRETEQKRKEAEDDAWAARKKRKEEERKWKERLEGERKWKERAEKAEAMVLKLMSEKEGKVAVEFWDPSYWKNSYMPALPEEEEDEFIDAVCWL